MKISNNRSTARVPLWLGFLFLILFAAGLKALPVRSESEGTVTGKVQYPGIEHYRGTAALWPNCQPSLFQSMKTIPPPEYMTALLPDGSFSLTAPPGRYCLGVVVRQTKGGDMGKPRPGDLVYFIPLMGGDVFTVDLRAGKIENIGLNQDGWILPGVQ